MKAIDRTGTLFAEEQRFGQKWIWLLIGLGAAVCWLAFVQQIMFGEPFGDRPAPDAIVWIIVILFGIGMPWLMLSLKLTVRVEPTRLVVRFRPLLTRKIQLKDIASCAPRTYRPIREYGGWGIRFSIKNGKAYNVSGNRGVQLELVDGKKVLIGSQRAEELAEAISKSIGSRHRT